MYGSIRELPVQAVVAAQELRFICFKGSMIERCHLRSVHGDHRGKGTRPLELGAKRRLDVASSELRLAVGQGIPN